VELGSVCGTQPAAEWPPRDNGHCEDKGKIDAFGMLLVDGGGKSPASLLQEYDHHYHHPKVMLPSALKPWLHLDQNILGYLSSMIALVALQLTTLSMLT
jgi:hypothetical protein